MKSIRFVVLLSLAATCFLPATAFAEGDTTLLVGVTGGFGGSFNGEWDSTIGNSDFQINLSDDIDDLDMANTWGGMLHYDTNPYQFFALGSRINIVGFSDQDRADDNWSRNTAIDLDLSPRLRFDLPKAPIELYLAVPFGVSILNASEDWKDEGNLDFGWGYGFNISALLGAIFEINNSFGVFVEAGWTMRTINFDGEVASGPASGTDVSLNGDINQFGGNLGMMLSF